MGEFALGQPVPRFEDPRLLRGGAGGRESGWGELPVPDGMRRRGGGPMYRPRFPALVGDRVRWVGDYVAFVVAETKDQAADAAELIEADYEELPALVCAEG